MMGVIYCKQTWHITWDWLPKNWSTFGWHTTQYDSVVYKALNIGPLSIHNDWVLITQKEGSE
jgi:hypothetical protein